jgi:hypothetical protein
MPLRRAETASGGDEKHPRRSNIGVGSSRGKHRDRDNPYTVDPPGAPERGKPLWWLGTVLGASPSLTLRERYLTSTNFVIGPGNGLKPSPGCAKRLK